MAALDVFFFFSNGIEMEMEIIIKHKRAWKKYERARN
jgi:hypothetical protein